MARSECEVNASKDILDIVLIGSGNLVFVKLHC